MGRKPTGRYRQWLDAAGQKRTWKRWALIRNRTIIVSNHVATCMYMNICSTYRCGLCQVHCCDVLYMHIMDLFFFFFFPPSFPTNFPPKVLSDRSTGRRQCSCVYQRPQEQTTSLLSLMAQEQDPQSPG